MPAADAATGLHLSEAASKHRLLSDPTRLSIVMVLGRGPSTVKSLAGATGVHVNTVRAHLGRLEDAGLVSASRQEPVGRGRPRMQYRLTGDAGVGGLVGRDYRLLSEVLVGLLRAHLGPEAAKVALKSGQAWGRHLAGPDVPAPGREPSAAGGAAYVARLLDRLQFAPEVRKRPGEWVVLSHNCPFREVAEVNQDLICTFHLGLIRGVLKTLGAPLDAGSLEPLIEPDLCRMRLSARGQAGGGSTRTKAPPGEPPAKPRARPAGPKRAASS